MMNLIVGGGVIGLPYAAANFGYMGFVLAISSVLCVAMTTQYFNLCEDYLDYEELVYLAAGKRRWGTFKIIEKAQKNAESRAEVNQLNQKLDKLRSEHRAATLVATTDMKALQDKLFRAQAGMECSICYEKYSPTRHKLVLIPCGHTCCHTCADLLNIRQSVTLVADLSKKQSTYLNKFTFQTLTCYHRNHSNRMFLSLTEQELLADWPNIT